MTGISDSLRLLFEASIERDGNRYVVPIPKELVESGSLSTEEAYRVALLTAAETSTPPEQTSESATDTDETESAQTEDEWENSNSQQQPTNSQGYGARRPPVEEGDVRSVTIDTLGDQGDGIAKVERGFVIIVPDTRPGDNVEVEITDVKQTVAFAEMTEEPTVR
ncbi:TRAM domain-containing protein [Haloferax sp. MBLA0076]|uniref:TRAM domain-containing protein n=1 Tax=Haloferax litoreum TaxID=2666140 RepID=A0A6A8GNS2_9EURY|nr:MULTISPECIES: TRAM domain-containing protein [Haloferax]KAB1190598.1 TRAM domain-containing protein [Haloferax sp. CBA1148]MRX23590.1 TRAM domain-containing protein [Haloferax litoreum]